jgi:putative transposase
MREEDRPMKKSRYTAEQIAFALRQAETGAPAPEVCRKMGISEQTFYRWKRRFAGMGVPEVRRLKLLEEENRIVSLFGIIMNRIQNSRIDSHV